MTLLQESLRIWLKIERFFTGKKCSLCLCYSCKISSQRGQDCLLEFHKMCRRKALPNSSFTKEFSQTNEDNDRISKLFVHGAWILSYPLMPINQSHHEVKSETSGLTHIR
jgi:hypothetical protein